jgi:iron complex transport system substrate-binding protein
MRVVTLQPFLTDILSYLGAGADLVGVSHLCEVPSDAVVASVVTGHSAVPSRKSNPDLDRLAKGLSSLSVDVEKLLGLNPDLILTDIAEGDPAPFCSWAEGVLEKELGRRIRVRAFSIRSLQMMYDAFEEIGVAIGKAREGRELTNRLKAQMMDWGDNFYPRMKNKKVTVLSGVNPLRVAGRWIPDIIKTASAQPQFHAVNELDKATTWNEIVTFRPDVMVVAPEGYSLAESVKTLAVLERVPQWEDIPAVKRGEVIFCEGSGLYRPGPKILKGAAVLFSAIAGMESGYITARDEFFRLRFVELHRHRFL